MTLRTKKSHCKGLIFVFLFLIFAGVRCFAQQTQDLYEDVFLYAKALEDGGAYEEAELEYKRYIFLQDYSEGIHQTQAFTALSGLYEKNGRWELAAQTMQKAILSEQNDEMIIKHIELLEKMNDEAAESKGSLSENLFIFSYINLPDFSDEVKQQALLAAVRNDVNNSRWGYAEKSFNQLTQEFPDFFTDEQENTIRSGFESINRFKPKKQMLAAYLSIFPGLGQHYAGNYADSLNSFLLNGSIIAVSAWSIYTLDLWTFSLLEFNPLIHFMQGNIYNAQKDVYEYNQRKYKAFSGQILEIVDNKIH